MAESIVIGDIKRTEFVDTSTGGTGGQIRTLINGEAVWRDNTEVTSDNILTSRVAETVVFNRDGNVLRSR